MSELRWTLLILGVVFIAALSWWERRRPRQAFAPHLRETSLGHADSQRTAGAASAATGEPWIAEEGLCEVVSGDMALTNSAQAGGSGGLGEADAQVEPTAPGPLEDLPVVMADDERLALAAAWDDPLPEPKLIEPEVSATDAAPIEPGPRADTEPREPEPEIAGAEGVGSVRIVEPVTHEEGPANPQPIVDWPPEDSRRILALRLVAPPERFAGRTLRLALSAEGFLLGKFSIFHKPDETNHALLSAASLTRPGSFDLGTIDSQRYGGLSLFAVLPGPKTPVQTFEELLATARNLNERLEGALQDERGGPLTPLRVANIRDNLRAEAANPPAAAAHGA